MKYKQGRGEPGAALNAMNSMLSRDARRDVIKMAVVIGGSGGGRQKSTAGVAGHRKSLTSSTLGKWWHLLVSLNNLRPV